MLIMKLMGTNYYKYSKLDIGKPVYAEYNGKKQKVGKLIELSADDSQYVLEVEDKYLLDAIDNERIISFEIASPNTKPVIIEQFKV